MLIKVLDRIALGLDTPIDVLNKFGEVTVYDSTPVELVVERCKDADVIVLNKVKITSEVLRAAEHLKLVCVFATGFDNIDVACARELGIAVCNVPGYSSESVALYTAATLLALTTRIFEHNAFVRSGEYTLSGSPNKLTPVFHELGGKTWGIVGYGGIGKAVADIAKAFGTNVIVNKRTPVDDVRCVDIDTLCRESDIITLHCPLNDATRGLINAERIAMMKPDVIIINEARGAVINERDLADAVKEGRIAAFGCDVYSTEPFTTQHPYYEIKDMPNVILTPHAAWGAYEARERCINIIADNIASFFNGKILNRVDI